MSEPLGNYIRAHRKKAGLSQRELAQLVGYCDQGVISKHEQLLTLPPLVVAIGYCVAFRIPIRTLFAGVHEAVEEMVERRVTELQQELQARAGQSAVDAQKQRWLSERRQS